MTLAAHERRLAQDLDILGLPAANWPATVPGPDGRPMLDVVVVGAGVFGLAAAAALTFKGIRNIAVLDRAPEGYEGPWLTTARMKTLRSPKGLPGLALGIPALSFRAWYAARFGEVAWDALYKIANAEWQDYLTWIRRVLALPVRNGVSVLAVRPRGPHLEVETDHGVLHARRVVLATGRSRADNFRIPEFVDPALWPDRAAHTAEAIDFDRLAGKRVVVLGGGASAWDNAATALEQGAARVDMLVRRPFLPQINKWRAAFNPGVFEGWASWPPALRWEWLVHLHDWPPPPPHESVHRVVAAHPHFALHLASPVVVASARGAGVALRVGPAGDRVMEADFLILATGFEVELTRVPELAALVPHIATWADRYAPPADLARPALGRLPFLGEGFELTEKVEGECPAVGRVHLFNTASVASIGPVASEIPGLAEGAQRLASRIAAAFSLEDDAHLRAIVEAYDEAELKTTPYYAPGAFAARS